jgi:hypothetical protein
VEENEECTVAGVKLDNNTGNTKQSERWVKWRQYLRKCETVAGVKLDNNTGNTKQSERWVKWRQNLRMFGNNEKRRHCEATKLYCNDNNEANDAMKRRQIRRIFENNHENEEYHGNTVAGAALRQQHRSTKPEKKPSWNVCSNGHDTVVMNWQYAGLRVRSKSSGLPIVGVSKYYTRQ